MKTYGGVEVTLQTSFPYGAELSASRFSCFTGRENILVQSIGPERFYMLFRIISYHNFRVSGNKILGGYLDV
jgi:hypothetical protein